MLRVERRAIGTGTTHASITRAASAVVMLRAKAPEVPESISATGAARRDVVGVAGGLTTANDGAYRLSPDALGCQSAPCLRVIERVRHRTPPLPWPKVARLQIGQCRTDKRLLTALSATDKDTPRAISQMPRLTSAIIVSGCSSRMIIEAGEKIVCPLGHVCGEVLIDIDSESSIQMPKLRADGPPPFSVADAAQNADDRGHTCPTCGERVSYRFGSAWQVHTAHGWIGKAPAAEG